MAATERYNGFKLTLQLRGEQFASSKDGQPQSLSPFFLVRRAHGKVKTDKGSLEAAVVPDASYHGNADKASIAYDGSSIHVANTIDPKWPRFEVGIERLCENYDLSKKIVFDFWDFTSKEFLGYILVSVQDLLLLSEFPVLGSNKGATSKVFVEHAELIPPTPYTVADEKAARNICGVILYQASADTPIDLNGLSEVDIAGKAAGGWSYYDTNADPLGNIRYEDFDKIISNCIKTLLSGVKAQLIVYVQDFLKSVVGALNPSLADANKSRIAEKFHDTRALFETLDKSYPLVAKALFRFFDVDGHGTIRRVTARAVFPPEPSEAARR